MHHNFSPPKYSIDNTKYAPTNHHIGTDDELNSTLKCVQWCSAFQGFIIPYSKKIIP